jgi:hypothetical protein
MSLLEDARSSLRSMLEVSTTYKEGRAAGLSGERACAQSGTPDAKVVHAVDGATLTLHY